MLYESSWTLRPRVQRLTHQTGGWVGSDSVARFLRATDAMAEAVLVFAF
jgi:transposase